MTGWRPLPPSSPPSCFSAAKETSRAAPWSSPLQVYCKGPFCWHHENRSLLRMRNCLVEVKKQRPNLYLSQLNIEHDITCTPLCVGNTCQNTHLVVILWHFFLRWFLGRNRWGVMNHNKYCTHASNSPWDSKLWRGGQMQPVASFYPAHGQPLVS